jgi:hypothetical protein
MYKIPHLRNEETIDDTPKQQYQQAANYMNYYPFTLTQIGFDALKDYQLKFNEFKVNIAELQTLYDQNIILKHKINGIINKIEKKIRHSSKDAITDLDLFKVHENRIETLLETYKLTKIDHPLMPITLHTELAQFIVDSNTHKNNLNYRIYYKHDYTDLCSNDEYTKIKEQYLNLQSLIDQNLKHNPKYDALCI